MMSKWCVREAAGGREEEEEKAAAHTKMWGITPSKM